MSDTSTFSTLPTQNTTSSRWFEDDDEPESGLWQQIRLVREPHSRARALSVVAPPPHQASCPRACLWALSFGLVFIVIVGVTVGIVIPLRIKAGRDATATFS
ncbi:hypothetical protein B0H11DRAFT_2226813 [Mycena galericulata]|nr:hypothetical protein B0H11DRAFT_2226813 [Mycena galericulata]